MKPSFSRRYRRRTKPAKTEGSFFKKESQHEHSFFGEAAHGAFFQPAVTAAQGQSIQRKCADCEKEDKQAQRKEDRKEEEKKVMRAPEKKEEEKKVQRKEEKKEEEKKVMRAPEKKEEEEKKVQRKEEKKEEDKKMQKKEAGDSSPSGGNVSNYVSSLNGKGQTMSATDNHFFSSRIGYDFSNVRIHTDKEAAESAKAINAKAYTIGNNIVFNEGQYNTESQEGKKLMAHELTHVIQQNEQTDAVVSRAVEENTEEVIPETPTFIMRDWVHHNTQHFANCAGVSVQGRTDANYSNSFTAPGRQRKANNCTDCTGDECITNTGTVISVFTTNPQVTLPAVPSGLSECEHTAVRNFINTTLRQHEQQHVAAFNTYRGIVRTPYSYTGCASGLDAHLQQIHDNIEVTRRASSDALSAALDPFNVPIPCDCPDTAQQSQAE
ncbi:DUF4157 domain-containing protein [Niastella caeni]|uniref:DUF4157 domain-containing protein n=1 Tax=Niastella caeni TaxID=2569763 RepID=A0A4S8I213_9BACT|nr:DUF4157 domain-containing protein [Niastella caeni]THU40584.1 DUF4157 domain-containing protein [Niastella caeni]